MKTQLKHGTTIETVTPDEMRTILAALTTREQTRDRVRASATIILDANGNGQDEVYAVPLGYEFELRRVFIGNNTSDPATNSILMSAAGRFAAYLRSGQLIEYASVFSYVGVAPQVPGVQTWGAEQGPYFRNGETLEVQFKGYPANTTISVYAEGVATKGGSLR